MSKPLKATTLVLGLAIVSASLSSCRGVRRSGPHGVSKATPKSSGAYERKLPPPDDMYEIIGFVPGIRGFVVKYDGKLYRGGELYSDAAAAWLREQGIRTLVSVTPTKAERKLAQKHGLELVELTFEKSDGPAHRDIHRLLDVLNASEGNVYAHCRGGTHRGGVLGVIYRVHALGWSEDKALLEFGRLGGSLMDDHDMLDAVLKWER